MTVRVRFCPSPTGTPHVGLMRTALFNWAYARHTGGTLVLRIEDTDAARDSAESVEQLLDAMAWLGLDHDEGPDVGGDYGPYRQSERREIHTDVASRLLAAGHAYESFSTPEEVESRHRAAGRDPKLGYDNRDRDLTAEQRQAFREEGRDPVLRLRMPDGDITFTDLVRGDVTFPAGAVPDFVIVRGNGDPLYTLVNPVDDAAMRITHVLRGEDLLSSTPRQIALYSALVDIGAAEEVPMFGHLPLVLGEGNRKLSKRAPEADLFRHRERGMTPEGMVNYLSLLGWAIAEDRDVFNRAELVEAFDIRDVNPNPARWDSKKAEAINGDHVRLLPAGEFRDRLVPYLRSAGLVGDALSEREAEILREAAPLVQTRMNLLGDAPGMLGFLFTPDTDLVVEPDALAALKDEALDVLTASTEALTALSTWSVAEIETELRRVLLDGLGLKPKLAFTPLRVAVTGRRVSPPLFESMEILGSEATLARLGALRARLSA